MPSPFHKHLTEEKALKYQDLTLDKLTEVIGQYFDQKRVDEPERPPDYWTPKEIYPGMWQIGPVTTGDGGMKMFEDALRKAGQEAIDKSK